MIGINRAFARPLRLLCVEIAFPQSPNPERHGRHVIISAGPRGSVKDRLRNLGKMMNRRLGHGFLQPVRTSEGSLGSVAHKKENIVGAERQHDRAWLDSPASEPGLGGRGQGS